MTAGCSWPAYPTTVAVEHDLGAATRMPRQLLRGAELELDVAGPPDDAHRLERIRRVDGTAGPPRARGFAQAGQDGADVQRLPGQRVVDERDLGLGGPTVDGKRLDRLGLRRRQRPPARCRTARRRWRRGTRCAPTPPAVRAAASTASCGRSASSGLSTVMVARRGIVGGQSPGVEDPRGQERRRQHLDETVERQRLSDRRVDASGSGVRPRPAGAVGRTDGIFSRPSSRSTSSTRSAGCLRSGRQLGGTTVTIAVGLRHATADLGQPPHGGTRRVVDAGHPVGQVHRHADRRRATSRRGAGRRASR